MNVNEESVNKAIFESRAAANRDPSVEIFKETQGVVSECQLLNIRQSPDPDSDIVGRLKKDTRVTLQKHEGDWYAISTPALSGWCMSKYISVDKNQEV